MSATLPIWDPQTNSWTYNGHPVQSIGGNTMYDPTTGYVMAAPIKDPSSLSPVVNPDGFQVFTEFTYDNPNLHYSPVDTKPLIPQKKASPIYYPRPESVAKVVGILRSWYPDLTVVEVDIEQGPNTPIPGVQFRKTDKEGNSKTSDVHATGQLAFSISALGENVAHSSLDAELTREGVL